MLLTALLVVVCILEVGAQDDLLQQVNAIKTDKRYVWGEAMNEDEEEAFSVALTTMKLKLEGRLNAKVDDQELLSKTKRIVRSMGDTKRVTAYIEVEEVKSVPPKEVEEARTTPPRKVEEAKTTASVPVAPKQEKQTTTSEASSAPGLDKTMGDIVAELMDAQHLQGAVTVLERFKRAGIIQQYMPFPKETNPQVAYLLILDAEYNIPLAVLSPEKNNGKRDNLVSGNEETLSDYHEKLAVCFSLAP